MKLLMKFGLKKWMMKVAGSRAPTAEPAPVGQDVRRRRRRHQRRCSVSAATQ